MKKPYQIESQRAVKRLEEMAVEGNPAVQASAAGLCRGAPPTAGAASVVTAW